MNKFPDELIKQYWVKKIPSKIQFIFDKSFEAKGIEKELNSFNDRLPKPFGDYVLLSREQEYELFLKFNYSKYRASEVSSPKYKRIYLSKAAYLKEIIAYHNMRLAYSWIVKFAKKVFEEELETEILYALNKAIDKFDVDRGFRFSTFASRVIQREVTNNLRYHNKHIHNSLIVSEGCCKATNGKSDWIEIVDDQGEYEESRSNAYFDVKTMVFKNRDLNKRERFILTKCYGLNNEKPLYLGEIGKKLGISKQRVFEIKANVIGKIRDKFEQVMAENEALTRC